MLFKFKYINLPFSQIEIEVNFDVKCQVLYKEIEQLMDGNEFDLYAGDLDCKLRRQYQLRKYFGMDDSNTVSVRIETKKRIESDIYKFLSDI